MRNEEITSWCICKKCERQCSLAIEEAMQQPQSMANDEGESTRHTVQQNAMMNSTDYEDITV